MNQNFLGNDSGAWKCVEYKGCLNDTRGVPKIFMKNVVKGNVVFKPLEYG